MAADQGLTQPAPDRRSGAHEAPQPLLLVPPLAWLVVAIWVRCGAAGFGFWTTNAFTGAVVHTFTADNIAGCSPIRCSDGDGAHRVGGVGGTVLCVRLQCLAFYMAKVASPRVRWHWWWR